MKRRTKKVSSAVLARKLFAQIKRLTWDKTEGRFRVGPDVDTVDLSILVEDCIKLLARTSAEPAGEGPTREEMLRDLDAISLVIQSAQNPPAAIDSLNFAIQENAVIADLALATGALMSKHLSPVAREIVRHMYKQMDDLFRPLCRAIECSIRACVDCSRRTFDDEEAETRAEMAKEQKRPAGKHWERYTSACLRADAPSRYARWVQRKTMFLATYMLALEKLTPFELTSDARRSLLTVSDFYIRRFSEPRPS